MKEARKGRATPEMRAVAREEGVPLSQVVRGVASGRIVIPHNPSRRGRVVLRGIGEGLRTKVNANVGSSPDYVDVEEEVRKARVAKECGADAVMDLSIGGGPGPHKEEDPQGGGPPAGNGPRLPGGGGGLPQGERAGHGPPTTSSTP